MGLGFKYHIATLVAIFFALTVGLVVGSLFVSPQVADSQKKILATLRDKMDKDVTDLRTQNKRYQDFFGQSAPRIVRSELNGISVAVVQMGDYPNAAGDVQETLRLAGAQVRCVVTCGKALAQNDDELKSALNTLQQTTSSVTLAQDRTRLFNQITALMITAAGRKEELANLFERGEIATFERNAEVKQAPQCVVVVVGTQQADSERVTFVDIPFLTALQGSGLKVLICEPDKVAVSDLFTYRSNRVILPSIDKVDTDIGRCQMVFHLKDLLTPSDTQGETTTSSSNHP